MDLTKLLMNVFLVLLFSSMIPSTVAADSADKAPELVVVLLPVAPSPVAADAAREFLDQFIRLAPPGTRLIFYDASRTRLGEAVIANAPPAGRIRSASRVLGTVVERLSKQTPPPANFAVDEVDLPGFVRTLGTVICYVERKPTRFVVIGSPYHTDLEQAASFACGQFPSLDHCISDPSASPYGTSGLTDLLNGVAVDWLTIDDQSNTRQRTMVSSFWSAYLLHLGAHLTTYLGSAADVAERAASNAMDPVPVETLKPTGRLQIITIDPIIRDDGSQPRPPPAPPARTLPAPPPPTPPAPPTLSTTRPITNPLPWLVDKPFEISAETNHSINRSVALEIVIDGSSSMERALQEAPKVSIDFAKIGSTLSRSFQMGILIHRGTDNISTWTGTIDPAGLKSLQRWETEPSMMVAIVEGSVGEHAGKSTGRTKMVTPFDPTVGFVNVENAVQHGLDTLEGLRAERQVLVLIGDAGRCEFDLHEGVSAADRASGQRTIEMVGRFHRDHPDARILTVYTGPNQGDIGFTDDSADTIEFFKEISATATDHGKYSDSFDDLPELVKRGILNP